MGKKGKGRSSAKATYHFDIQQELQKVSAREKPGRSTTRVTQRPRLTTGLATLRNLIRERRSHEHYEWTEQRRREGYLPQQSKAVGRPVSILEILPTELLGTSIFSAAERNSFFENSTTPSLQTMCLRVLGKYLGDYLDAMGTEQLHGVLSLLPSETLGALSMLTSYNTGIDNNLAFVLGHHPHVTSLSFRASDVDDSLNGDGLLSLLPEVEEETASRLESSWEDLDDFDGEKDVIESIGSDGTAYRLKRLELVECPSITVDSFLAFLENQPFIRRLSIAGCFNREDGGENILQMLPRLLPSLESLDLRRCSWASPASIQHLVKKYEGNQNGSPEIHYQDGQMYGGSEAW